MITFMNTHSPRTEEAVMTRLLATEAYSDSYEYHGSTVIEHIRTLSGKTVWRDWIMFDTVEEACDYFNAECAD
jgi:hypothetical protein